MPLFDEQSVVDATRYALNAKACIQKNGRLGFTREAAELLSLNDREAILFSCLPSGDLAAVFCSSKEPRGFKIQKAGNYFYIRLKNFFDSLSLDYIRKRVSFDISETAEEYKGQTVFKFTRGIYDRKSNDYTFDPEQIETQQEGE